jgi:hypothetical protein
MRRPRQRPDEGWRWLALLIVLINVSFNYFSGNLLPGNSVMHVGGLYQSLYTPADYSFLIWGAIGFSVIVYSIYQLLPSQSDERIYDELAKPFILTNLFSMAWLIAFRMDVMPVSMFFISCTLIMALVMYIKVRDAVLRDDNSAWLSVPFSLLAGWLSVLVIANASILFISLGLHGSVSSQMVWTIVMILGSGILGIWVCARCRDFVFPFVISWALIAIFIARQPEFPYIGVVALVAAAMPAIWIVTTLVRRISYRQRIWANKLSF